MTARTSPRLMHAVLLLLLAAAFAGGCDPKEKCDPDQLYQMSICIQKSPAAPDGGGETDAGGGAGDALCADPGPSFGATCTAVAQCPCGLDECVTFAAMNYCTRRGCDKDPSICPKGWSCFDATGFGGPHFCMRP